MKIDKKIITETLGINIIDTVKGDNRLIAEFMGIGSDYLKYNSNWNWLMEVVEKIESLTDINSSGCFMVLESIGFNAKFILDDGTRIFNPCKGETKIEAVYNACVEFIKWYNLNK